MTTHPTGIKSLHLTVFANQLFQLLRQHQTFPKKPTFSTLIHRPKERHQPAFTITLHQVLSLIYNGKLAFLHNFHNHSIPEVTQVKDRWVCKAWEEWVQQLLCCPFTKLLHSLTNLIPSITAHGGIQMESHQSCVHLHHLEAAHCYMNGGNHQLLPL
jgi:hypothetical protein